MSGGYFMRVINNSGSTVGGITTGNQGLFSDGTYTMQLGGLMLRGASSSGPAGSVPGAKARITALSVVSPTSSGTPQWSTVSATAASFTATSVSDGGFAAGTKTMVFGIPAGSVSQFPVGSVINVSGNNTAGLNVAGWTVTVNNGSAITVTRAFGADPGAPSGGTTVITQSAVSFPAGLSAEVGHIDNDGYMTVYFSSI